MLLPCQERRAAWIWTDSPPHNHIADHPFLQETEVKKAAESSDSAGLGRQSLGEQPENEEARFSKFPYGL